MRKSIAPSCGSMSPRDSGESALQQYRELERLLKEELDAEPSATTRDLARSIQHAPVEARRSGSPPHRRWGQPEVGAERSPHAGRLPASLTRFFGREEDIARLRTLLLVEDRRLVTLTGPGGSGKTRLALEVAYRLREQFSRAIWFVPLQDLTDPRLILQEVLHAVALPRSPQSPPLEQLVAFLTPQRSLLVLDNFEHLLPHGAVLIQKLLEQTATLTVLITSRRRLNLLGERECPVPPLPVPDRRAEPEALLQNHSVQLFVDRVQAVRPDFRVTDGTAADVAALCACLEGLPLALVLAAARASVLTPAQMLTRLAPRLDFLAGQGHRTAHASPLAAGCAGLELSTPVARAAAFSRAAHHFSRRLDAIGGGNDLRRGRALGRGHG